MRDVSDRDSFNEFLRPSWMGFLVLCGLAGFLTFTGVYDAVTELPFWLGWLYWLLTLVIGCLVGYGVIASLGKLDVHKSIPYGASLIAATAAVTAVIAILQISIGHPVPLSFIPFLFGQVFVISMMIFFLGYVSSGYKKGLSSEAAKRDPVKHFLEHLPMKYRDAELYAISSEDHYLRVHTNKGEDLILMRLSDAIHDLKDADGLQTHRSWWVASSAISDVKKENGRVEFVLKSGVLAPVSRTYQSNVKAANWY